MSNQDRRPVAIELFCGAGGMSLGFEAAGFDVLVAIDNDPIHLATHEWNFPRTHSICSDIKMLSAEDVLVWAKARWASHYPDGQWPDEVDCIFGGPSCQGFSEIGLRNPADERNNLIAEFARIVIEIRPKYFAMENVPGLLAPTNRSLLATALKTFRDAGYNLTMSGPFLLNAADYGVPQMRRRVFIVGSRPDMLENRTPSSAGEMVTVSDALDDLRCLERYTTLVSQDAVRLSPITLAKLENTSSDYARFLRSGPDPRHGCYGLGYLRPWDRALMTCSARTTHRADVVDRFRKTPEGAEELVSRLPRLRSSGQATTLRAGTGRDHGSFTSARPIHHIYPRVITVREAARLDSFPDWFRFHTTRWHGFRQVGNAVPPLLARAIAQSIVNALELSPKSLHDICSEPGSDQLLNLTLHEAAEYFDVDPATLPKDNRLRNKGAVK